ncbi:MAG TPA: type II toxin-antitoxin system VapC family toxin [Edaphobacter sp.]|nr:type II toxin-antitoxin system VapC family toxin [Edaphobacter sp.]
MSRSYVLDTSALLNLLRGRELGELIDRTFRLREAPYLHTLSVVTHAELWVLIDRNKWREDKKSIVERVLQEFVTVDVAGSLIVSAYRRVEAASAGIAMGKNDIWIAATAVITGLPIVTTDKDFNHLNGKLIDVQYIDPKSIRIPGKASEILP